MSEFTVEGLKLAALSPETFSDDEVQRIFLDTVLESDNDIHEIMGCLRRHRPQLMQTLDEACRTAQAQALVAH